MKRLNNTKLEGFELDSAVDYLWSTSGDKETFSYILACFLQLNLKDFNHLHEIQILANWDEKV